MIEIKNLTVSYKKNKVLKDVSLSIPKGKWVSILGHNGSGKSTLAKSIMGIVSKDSGSISIDNIDLNDENISNYLNKIGIVFQNPDNQFVGGTVLQDIVFGMENRCFTKSKMDSNIKKYSRLLGIEDILDRMPHTLSGGQKQRVAVAGILCMECEYIIFDEAASMLDPEGRKQFTEVINNLKNSIDITIISITHNMNIALASDLSIVLKDGQVAKVETPKNLFSNLDDDLNLEVPINFSIMAVLKEKNKLSKEMEAFLWELNL